MLKLISSSLRMRLMLLTLLAVIPALGMIFYTEHLDSIRVNRQIQNNLHRLVQMSVDKYSRLLTDTREMLYTLSRTAEVSEERRVDCSQLFGLLKSGYGHYANIGAISASGDLFCSAVPTRSRIKTKSDGWFNKALTSGDFVLSDFHVGRITGVPVLVAALGRKDISKVVFASIDLRLLSHWLGQRYIDKNTSVMLLDAHGVILSHYPDHNDWVGLPQANTVLWRTILASDSEGSFEAVGSDGVSRLYDFSPLMTRQGQRIFIVAGVQSSVIQNEITSIRNATLVGSGVVALFFVLIIWYGSDAILLRQIQAVIAAARQLADGNLEARTGLAHQDNDIGKLARAFDDMATELQTKNLKHIQLGHDIRVSEEKLRNMVDELQRTREEERRHIAQDIHDEVGGMLAALKMDINRLSNNLNNTDGTAREIVSKISEHIDMLIQFVRRIITNLRPSILDNLGLVEAIEWQLTEFKARYNIEVQLDKYLPEGDIEFKDDAYSASLFRIFQEIITNIAKHAEASMVNVFISIVDGKFVLSVSDNGCGLDETSRNKVGAFGIQSIEERVQSLGGECVFVSKQEIGTTFSVQVPIIQVKISASA